MGNPPSHRTDRQAGISTFPSTYSERITHLVIAVSSIMGAVAMAIAAVGLGITRGYLHVLATCPLWNCMECCGRYVAALDMGLIESALPREGMSLRWCGVLSCRGDQSLLQSHELIQVRGIAEVAGPDLLFRINHEIDVACVGRHIREGIFFEFQAHRVLFLF